MTDRQLTLALSALAQPTRFRIMRELVAAIPRGGLSAGEAAEAIGKGDSGTAVHLKELERAGLVLSAHNGHAVFYRPEPATMRAFVDGLGGALGLVPVGAGTVPA